MVSNMPAGESQEQKHTSRKQKLARRLHNRQARDCVGQTGFKFMTHGLSADIYISLCIRTVSLLSVSFGIITSGSVSRINIFFHQLSRAVFS